MKITKKELKQMIYESVQRVLLALNEGGKWLGGYNRDSVDKLFQTINVAFKKGETEVSFELNSVDFTIEKKDDFYYFSSGQFLEKGKGRAKDIKSAIKYCWQISQQKKES